MEVQVVESFSGKTIPAEISAAEKEDMPLRKNGWKFTWRELFKVEGAEFYKLCLKESPNEIQGLIMLSLMNQEMMYLNNIEVAPHNYGRKGQYEKVAGALIAYGCLLSFEKGRGHYEGFLAFESKTELIPFYQNEYGATHAMGQRMFFGLDAGRNLMKKYLNRSFNE